MLDSVQRCYPAPRYCKVKPIHPCVSRLSRQRIKVKISHVPGFADTFLGSRGSTVAGLPGAFWSDSAGPRQSVFDPSCVRTRANTMTA